MFILRLGERVHFLLKKYNKSQKELADFLNTKTSTINGWKQPNRNPSSDMIVPICKFFKISTDYFLTNNIEEFYENNVNSKEYVLTEKRTIHDYDQNILAQRLKLLRKKYKLKQEDIGSLVGVTKTQISDIENSKASTSIKNLITFADYFNVSLDYLVGRDEPNISDNKKSLILSLEESELLEDFKQLNKYEKTIIRGKISEFIYNKNIENDNLEVSQELINADVINRLNK